MAIEQCPEAPNLNGVAEGWLDLEQLSAGSRCLGLMVGCSPSMIKVFGTITRLAPYKAAVLIQGESGTGKELVARALHTMGAAPRGPFVTFNCSNLMDSLAESQLFGHVRGAFTDAREESLGYFRSANGGTLFLDEIAELPMRLQPKLLRAVETFEVQPVGSAINYHTEVRLLAATNRDLRAMVSAGQFRDDLYYRLNTTSILLEPLRSHPEDIDILVSHFVERYNRILGKNIALVSAAAIRLMRRHRWPGNVRELSNALESAMIFAAADRIDLADLPADLLEPGNEVERNDPPMLTASPRSAAATADFAAQGIRETLLRSLKQSRGNRRRAADLLGISRSTFYRLMSRYEIM